MLTQVILILKAFAKWMPIIFWKQIWKSHFLRYYDKVVFKSCFSSILLIKLRDMFRCFYFSHQYLFSCFVSSQRSMCEFEEWHFVKRMEKKFNNHINAVFCYLFLPMNNFTLITRNNTATRYFYIRIVTEC